MADEEISNGMLYRSFEAFKIESASSRKELKDDILQRFGELANQIQKTQSDDRRERQEDRNANLRFAEDMNKRVGALERASDAHDSIKSDVFDLKGKFEKYDAKFKTIDEALPGFISKKTFTLPAGKIFVAVAAMLLGAFLLGIANGWYGNLQAGFAQSPPVSRSAK